jgi:hypothetical protein
MYNSTKAGRTRRIRCILIAAGGLCGLGLLNSAIASPTLSRVSASRPATESARSTLAVGRSLAHQVNTSAAPLDLRAPQESPSATIHQGAGALTSEPFPSVPHHLVSGRMDLGREDHRSEDGMRRPAFGADAMSFNEMSQPQIIAQRIQRIRREGLPIARLWESKSAALSIGLNQRGKPGLWFTQRMH